MSWTASLNPKLSCWRYEACSLDLLLRTWQMASFKSRDRDPEAEAARLKRKFQAVSRRIEWRLWLKEAFWWLTLCGVASAGAFAGMTILRLLVPEWGW